MLYDADATESTSRCGSVLASVAVAAAEVAELVVTGTQSDSRARCCMPLDTGKFSRRTAASAFFSSLLATGI